MSKERIKEIERILNPDPYHATLEEDVLAKVRCELEDVPWVMLQYYARSLINKPEFVKLAEESPEIKELSDKIIKEYKEMEEWYDTDIAKHLEHYVWIKSGLGAMHMGDCTRMPAGCMRCAAETYYNIPSTAIDVYKGSELVYELMRLEKEEREKDE